MIHETQDALPLEVPAVAVGTYTETETAIRLGIDRTSVRRIALTRPEHPIAKACLRITENKRVYSRLQVEAYINGEEVE